MAVVTSFKPGMGRPVGKVVTVSGRVRVVHKKGTVCYLAEKDTPLFKGDTLATMAQGRVELIFTDASRISIAPETTLVINELIFDNSAGQRSSFFSLPRGKARFWVKKLLEFRRSAFRVKTRTSIAGVRGSDFIVLADPGFTEVIALDRTTLAITRLANPESAPVILTDFMRVRETPGTPISKPERVSPGILRDHKAKLPFKATPPMGDPPFISGSNAGKGEGELIPEKTLVPPESDLYSEDKTALDLLMFGHNAPFDNEQQQIFQIMNEFYLTHEIWHLPDFPAPP
jgi:hypothetical protein